MTITPQQIDFRVNDIATPEITRRKARHHLTQIAVEAYTHGVADAIGKTDGKQSAELIAKFVSKINGRI